MSKDLEDPLSILGAYLNQDWKVFYPTVQLAILRLFRDEPPEITEPPTDEIRRLLESPVSDSEIDSKVTRYVDYSYGRAGKTARQFLTEILAIGTSVQKRLDN